MGIEELGAKAIVLNSQNTQIGRGESSKDTAIVLSRYLHGLVIRAYDHSVVTEFAKHATMPIVNGLTDFNHPCQVLTDIFSILERIDPENIALSALQNKKIAFFGDTASNMANSWIIAATYIGFDLVLAGPKGYEPTDQVLEKLKTENIDVTLDGRGAEGGGLHPVSIARHRIEDIFVGAGYEVVDGEEIETDYYNFEALNLSLIHI